MHYSMVAKRYQPQAVQKILKAALTALAILLLPITALATTTLLVLGDSLSSGYGLFGPGWVALTNQSLVAEGINVNLVNHSISGDTTAGGVARIADDIERIKPDWVVIELGGNDGLRGIAPKVIIRNLQTMIDICTANGVKTMLLGVLIPPNYGRVYTAAFANTFVQVSEANNVPLLPFFIGEVGGNPALNQADGIHPNDIAQPLIRDWVLPFIKASLGLQ